MEDPEEKYEDAPIRAPMRADWDGDYVEQFEHYNAPFQWRILIRWLFERVTVKEITHVSHIRAALARKFGKKGSFQRYWDPGRHIEGKLRDHYMFENSGRLLRCRDDGSLYIEKDPKKKVKTPVRPYVEHDGHLYLRDVRGLWYEVGGLLRNEAEPRSGRLFTRMQQVPVTANDVWCRCRFDGSHVDFYGNFIRTRGAHETYTYLMQYSDGAISVRYKRQVQSKVQKQLEKIWFDTYYK